MEKFGIKEALFAAAALLAPSAQAHDLTDYDPSAKFPPTEDKIREECMRRGQTMREKFQKLLDQLGIVEHIAEPDIDAEGVVKRLSVPFNGGMRLGFGIEGKCLQDNGLKHEPGKGSWKIPKTRTWKIPKTRESN